MSVLTLWPTMVRSRLFAPVGCVVHHEDRIRRGSFCHKVLGLVEANVDDFEEPEADVVPSVDLDHLNHGDDHGDDPDHEEEDH